MPCDTPPPPGLEDIEDAGENDVDEMLYDFVDDMEILEEGVIDDSAVTFSGHKDSVFCCNFDKNRTLAVSGGQDEKAFVWYVSNGEAKFECIGHRDSVIAAAFNHDSTYVATADMGGLIQAWDVDSGTKVWNFETSELLWMEWHHNSNILLAGTNDGNCWKWSIPDGDTGLFQSHGFGSVSGKILPNGERCAVGYTDGTVRLWNINELSIAGSVTGPSAHEMAVNCLDCNSDNTLILTGSEDGTSKLIKSSDSKVLWTMKNCLPGSGHQDVSVESVGFFQSHHLMATGTNCGCLSIWDISSQTQRLCCNVEEGASIVKLICGNTSPVVYIGTSEGEIALYDARSGQKEKNWIGHDLAILDLVISRDYEWILSSSDDHTCKIFQVK